eukprot:CAMPEP_0174300928 /NCGR_PEP_ID=MMETSP0809-20121228/58748_1 /TAXON_ID=73025 ORGANISM="Eutreptiella gymnastica-like, Strain CCMP1594" /NCGR_SAMPLE_ID=MMETSP0809 /ASSEMBLY_ACC=CAM_ASM_000658 /LENGTH=49 /DNA_ID= /DNA_START= /DNA_END= /DNA_ORIENTATION=
MAHPAPALARAGASGRDGVMDLPDLRGHVDVGGGVGGKGQVWPRHWAPA